MIKLKCETFGLNAHITILTVIVSIVFRLNSRAKVKQVFVLQKL